MIEFDGRLLQPINKIVEIEVDGNAMDIKPMDIFPQSLSYMKKVIASSNPDPMWIDFHWTDIKSITNCDWVGTFWQAAKDDKAPWVEIDLGMPQNQHKFALTCSRLLLLMLSVQQFV